MRIAILTSGRFHVCDLARELDALGHDVAFYSLVPPWRTRQFGLPARCDRWLAPLLAPLVGLKMANLPPEHVAWVEQALNVSLDMLASRLIGRCDVFIGMAGLSLRTARAVKRRFGARVFIERGSRHILSQQEILAQIAGRPVGSARDQSNAVLRELEEYALADVLVVPAKHTFESFTERGMPAFKLFQNPYGVDLEMFPPTARSTSTPTVLMVGGWSYRKGVDVLWDACERIDAPLLHVGPRGDAPFPQGRNFTHVDAMDQRMLTHAFAKGDVFALASREEGLATVQVQALASGLPLVCSDRTGGADLADVTGAPEWVSVVPHDNAEQLARALRVALDRPRQPGLRVVPGREKLSWKAYGRRYHDELLRRIG
jgi:starch synthase